MTNKLKLEHHLKHLEEMAEKKLKLQNSLWKKNLHKALVPIGIILIYLHQWIEEKVDLTPAPTQPNNVSGDLNFLLSTVVGTGGYTEHSVMLDFYNESMRTMFLLKYSHIINESRN